MRDAKGGAAPSGPFARDARGGAEQSAQSVPLELMDSLVATTFLNQTTSILNTIAILTSHQTMLSAIAIFTNYLIGILPILTLKI